MDQTQQAPPPEAVRCASRQRSPRRCQRIILECAGNDSALDSTAPIVPLLTLASLVLIFHRNKHEIFKGRRFSRLVSVQRRAGSCHAAAIDGIQIVSVGRSESEEAVRLFFQ